MIKEAIVKIVNKEDLTYDEAYTVMNEIMSGETTATQNAAFLAALSTKSARENTQPRLKQEWTYLKLLEQAVTMLTALIFQQHLLLLRRQAV